MLSSKINNEDSPVSSISKLKCGSTKYNYSIAVNKPSNVPDPTDIS